MIPSVRKRETEILTDCCARVAQRLALGSGVDTRITEIPVEDVSNPIESQARVIAKH